MDSPIVVAILVFLSIYFVFLLIRLLSDMIIVGIALSSAILAYNIKGHYSEFLPVLQESPFLTLFGVNLPTQPDTSAIYLIAIFIILIAILFCLPFLPFSATYRYMLGVEKPLFSEQAKVRGWILEELERNRYDDRGSDEEPTAKS